MYENKRKVATILLEIYMIRRSILCPRPRRIQIYSVASAVVNPKRTKLTLISVQTKNPSGHEIAVSAMYKTMAIGTRTLSLAASWFL